MSGSRSCASNANSLAASYWPSQSSALRVHRQRGHILGIDLHRLLRERESLVDLAGHHVQLRQGNQRFGIVRLKLNHALEGGLRVAESTGGQMHLRLGLPIKRAASGRRLGLRRLPHKPVRSLYVQIDGQKRYETNPNETPYVPSASWFVRPVKIHALLSIAHKRRFMRIAKFVLSNLLLRNTQ